MYVADAVQRHDGSILHFWKTDGAIADMYRVYWDAADGTILPEWTRGLALADFDGDGRFDLCLSGAMDYADEQGAVLSFWYGLDPARRQFQVHYEFPDFPCSDVAAVSLPGNDRAGVIVTDLDGTIMECWMPSGTGEMDFERRAQVPGYAGLSPQRGMAAVVADVNGDGLPDLITKQKLGGEQDWNQIEVTVCRDDQGYWHRLDPTPIDSEGFANEAHNEILRPRNLAVGDLVGNTLPEIVAGFGRRSGESRSGGTGEATLDIAVWVSSCLGDVNWDGRTNVDDVRLVLGSMGLCADAPDFNPDADLDKDGCITHLDAAIVYDDLGCLCGAVQHH